jgi:hypothetical protein
LDAVKRYRRLRRLLPDDDLVRRRAAGEPLRRLALDYGVAHTTLARYFGRPEAAQQLRRARRGAQVERRAVAAEQLEERRLVREVRRQARERAAQARERARRAGSGAGRPLTVGVRGTRINFLAEQAVRAGGGLEAVAEATGLRTRANVLQLIDVTLLLRALDNDRAAAVVREPGRQRLRRLRPDLELVRRRAAGEPLRRLAADYGVAHTTLSRWFRRPEVAGQLRGLERAQGRRVMPVPGQTGVGHDGESRC